VEEFSAVEKNLRADAMDSTRAVPMATMEWARKTSVG
jgi:hypothetical protein